MININTDIARRLIAEQFPEWSNLSIYPVKESGNDNRTFHLGEEMSIRLPSAECYVPQVEKENQWLAYLAEKLLIPISVTVAKGKATEYYPWSWSIMKWIKGETVNSDRVKDLNKFAGQLADFLTSLYSIETAGAPPAGKHNFFRGASLSVYDNETRQTLEILKDEFEETIILEIWGRALSTKWTEKPVWVHGDMAVGNILVDKLGNLCGVIDFGILGVGDPACDLVMFWTFFDKESGSIFKEAMLLDENTWSRARGWALWKALISYRDYKKTKAARQEKEIINNIINEFLSAK